MPVANASQNVVDLAVVDVSQEKPEPLEHLTQDQQQGLARSGRRDEAGFIQCRDLPGAGQLLHVCDLGALSRRRAARMRHQIRPKKGENFAGDAHDPKRDAVAAGNKTEIACANKYAPSQAGHAASSQPWNIGSVRPYSDDDKPAA